jgi:hypothetical protein
LFGTLGTLQLSNYRRITGEPGRNSTANRFAEQEKLRISYDALNDDTEKEIFLDIACFFIGMDRNDVTLILNGCELFAEIGISLLVERSLVTVDDKNKLGMHDLLRDMGREIIRGKSPEELEERCRLWFQEDVLHVLSDQTVRTSYTLFVDFHKNFEKLVCL